MAPPPRSVTVVSLLLLLLSATMSVPAPVAAEADDEAALLAFKAAAIGGLGGVTCGSRHRRVVALSLPSLGLTGVLSPAVGNLSFLRALNLSSNAFSGDIPASLGRLRRLQILDLSYNTFSGEIPANLSSCTSLLLMRLRFNQFRGHVPSELGDKLVNLVVLSLWNNSLTGTIPASLANLSSLNILSLGLIQLHGTIPPGLGGIQTLLHLDLNNNNLSGKLPKSLYNLSSLERLQVQGNMIQDKISASIGNRLSRLQILELYANQFTGPIPVSLSNLTALQILDLSENMLSGYVPREMGRSGSLQSLLLENNMLEADDKEGWEFITALSNCTEFTEFEIGVNAGLTGQLPSSIVNLTSVEFLRFDQSGISGSIPSAISNLLNLEVLEANLLGKGSFGAVYKCTLPDEETMAAVKVFNLEQSGSARSFIVECEALRRPSNILLAEDMSARVGDFGISRILPQSASKTQQNSNSTIGIKGSIGYVAPEYGEGSAVTTYGDVYSLATPANDEAALLAFKTAAIRCGVGDPLASWNTSAAAGDGASYCSWEGVRCEGSGRHRRVVALSLYSYGLPGTLSPAIGNLTFLQVLNLSSNWFHGTIPAGVGRLVRLKTLDLSYNAFSVANNSMTGAIPGSLSNMSSLNFLDLTINQLDGPIPPELGSMGALQVLELFGNSLSGVLPHSLYNLSLLTYLGLHYNMLSGTIPADIGNRFPRMEILSFSGNLFSGSIPPSLSNLSALTKLGLAGNGFIGYVPAALGKLQGLTDLYLNDNRLESNDGQGWELITFLTNCSNLQHLVLGNNSFSGELPSSIANLSTTLQTLYLGDNNISGPIPSNIGNLIGLIALEMANSFLSGAIPDSIEDLSARVEDFGISKILPDDTSKTLLNSISFTGLRGSIGYVAPARTESSDQTTVMAAEYGEGCAVSTLGDVYSLGILLLELFTGRSPADDMFKDSLGLHKFAETALPNRALEIADPAIWLPIEAAKDHASAAAMVRRRSEGCLVSAIGLGVACSKHQPRERMPVRDACDQGHVPHGRQVAGWETVKTVTIAAEVRRLRAPATGSRGHRPPRASCAPAAVGSGLRDI
nr:unnamed protein product [Digitaria exilis]